MPRDGAIIFGDLIGKLDVLRVACDKYRLFQNTPALDQSRICNAIQAPPSV